jgi:hypothetical protein
MPIYTEEIIVVSEANREVLELQMYRKIPEVATVYRSFRKR